MCSLLSSSRIIWETIKRAFSLSSAGTTYQGAIGVLVAFKHRLVCFHVLFPVIPFVDVRKAEFPVLFRFINSFQEAFSLFVLWID